MARLLTGGIILMVGIELRGEGTYEEYLIWDTDDVMDMTSLKIEL